MPDIPVPLVSPISHSPSVELRDGAANCTNHCVGTAGIGGNPLSWNGVRIGDYRILEYRQSGSEGAAAFNYDGVAVNTALESRPANKFQCHGQEPAAIIREGRMHGSPMAFNPAALPRSCRRTTIYRRICSFLAPFFSRGMVSMAAEVCSHQDPRHRVAAPTTRSSLRM